MSDLNLIESLGAFPIIQIGIAAVVVGGFAVATWRGLRESKRPQQGGVEMFFDGPIVTGIKALDRLAAAAEKIVAAAPDVAKMREEWGEKLRLSRHEMYTRMHDMQVDWEKDHDALEARVRDLETGRAAADADLRNLRAGVPQRRPPAG